MSKFKTNDSVYVKATGKKGIVKGREVIDLGNNRVKVEYIVKTGPGFENWHSYNRNELVKEVYVAPKKENPSYVTTTANGYKITTVGVVEKTYNMKRLSIGYAICSPEDEFNLEYGIKLATNRAKTNSFGTMYSAFGGEFNTETVSSIIKAKGDYIARNIEKFVNLS